MALYEAYVNGVSTRKMKKITEVLLGKGFSSSSISWYAEELTPLHSMESEASEILAVVN
jgi:transposase-like protein